MEGENKAKNRVEIENEVSAEVEVRVVTPDEEAADETLGQSGWELVFRLRALSLEVEYVVSDPQLIKAQRWQDLANGEFVKLYVHVGGGLGHIAQRGGISVEFEAGTPGHRGSALSRVTVPLSVVSDPLKRALKEAADRGFFADSS